MENDIKKITPETDEIVDSDFVFAQDNGKIEEKKFQTKPTTFFKDAMKRFVKNRSSVIAAGILMTLIAMAIIVPIADGNDITFNVGEAQYLPPKWFDADMGGFFDGTTTVSNVVLDPHEKDANGNYVLPSDSKYIQNAIIGTISATSSYADSLTDAVKKYGKNGSISLVNVGETDKASNEWKGAGIAGLLSPELTFTSAEEVSYTVTLDKEGILAELPEDNDLRYFLGFLPTGSDDVVRLTETATYVDQTEIACANVNAVLSSTEPTVKGKLGLFLEEPGNLVYSVDAIHASKIEAVGSVTDLSKASFNDATKALTALEAGEGDCYSRYGKAKLTIYHSEVLYGSFRYDPYKAVFGSYTDDDPRPVFTERRFSPSQIQDYVDKGWIIYDWGNPGDTQPARFELTESGKIYCPLRQIVSQRYEVNPFFPDDEELNIREVTGLQSFYRVLYAEGHLAKCEAPKYIFGSDRNGLDFFKVVFSGLLVSLGLGVLSAGINIVIGLFFGSITGYFGGWIDLLLERFMEILGGMPWIVMMTLIVLLVGHSSFGIFLFALCITGWMGISGTTRSQFYRYKGREYVLASRTLGASDGRLIFRHILPNSIGTIVTGAVLMIPGVIFTEANVSYLLPGTMQLTGSFGVTLSNAQGDLRLYPYLILSASIVMALLMICFNLFGNGLRDAFNPSLKGSDE